MLLDVQQRRREFEEYLNEFEQVRMQGEPQSMK